MAEAFNLNSFLREQATYNQRQYTAIENGQAAMEARAVEKAQEAIAQTGFLGLTLSEKMAELGVGERVIQQLGDTAVNAIENIVSPISDYLAKYEHIYDQNVYNAEIQAMGKQMFFARQALAQEAALTDVGQKFVYDM
jgi:hypothetical protein